VGVSKLCKHLYNAKQIVEEINKKFSSKGGGSNTFATAIIPGKEPKKVLNYLRELL
jgi:alanyl-tRNA synthetase